MELRRPKSKFSNEAPLNMQYRFLITRTDSECDRSFLIIQGFIFNEVGFYKEIPLRIFSTKKNKCVYNINKQVDNKKLYLSSRGLSQTYEI